MIQKLTDEQIAALHDNDHELKVIDPNTNRVYVIVDQDNDRVP